MKPKTGKSLNKAKIRETSRDYRNPFRPFPVAAVNTFGRFIQSMGIKGTLDPDKLIRSALRSSGGMEISTDYREGLGVLLDSIESEARLNPVGRMIIRGRIVSLLKTRFKAEALLESQPEILQQSLSTPIIITGLQRTGTTLLHRIIAADQRFRSLTSWEVLDPVPPPKNFKGKDPRLKAALLAQKGAAWLAPDFFAVHPIDYTAPEEEVLLLDASFKSTVAEAIMRVPGYSTWLESADSRPAYEFMRKLLLIYQNQNARPYWILKTPHHLEYLDVLLEVFPSAKVIQTHRDPSKTSGSFLSMVAHGYGMFTDSPDPEEIGQHWTRKCKRMVETGMAFRSTLNKSFEKSRFLDIQYSDLMTDIPGTLEKVYDFAGLDFNEQARENARLFLEKNGKHRYGRHCYNLKDFGFTPEELRKTFESYRETYSIPDED